MRTAELTADDQIPGGEGELNLGLGSLLGIFFGLALVCGVFFGFGYMIGHRIPGPYVSSEPLYIAPRSQPVAPKPSGQIASQTSDTAIVALPAQEKTSQPITSQANSQTPPADNTESNSASTAAQKNVSTSPTIPPQQPKPAILGLIRGVTPAPPNLFTVKPAVATPSASSTGTIMVQIAAVKSRPDAEALAAALQKNGFSPAVRSEPQDKLLHVQVGPFNNRDDAKAMRQKLSSAGYNAFIK